MSQMSHLTANTAKADFDVILNGVIVNGQTVSIATDSGAAVLINQKEFIGLLETLYLHSVQGMRASVMQGMSTPIEDCVPLSEVWNDL